MVSFKPLAPLVIVLAAVLVVSGALIVTHLL
jgi:hypothetical protein